MKTRTAGLGFDSDKAYWPLKSHHQEEDPDVDCNYFSAARGEHLSLLLRAALNCVRGLRVLYFEGTEKLDASASMSITGQARQQQHDSKSQGKCWRHLY